MQHFGVCKKRAFGIAMPLPGLLNDKYRQAVRIMKITAFILLVCTLHVSAAGYSQSITLSEKEAPLDKVFKSIEKQTDYIFFYNVDWVNKAEKVNVEVKNMQLLQVLNLLFKNQPLTYSITGKMITVFPKKDDQSINSENLPASPIDIHGKVVDENGKSLSGVTVIVKGTKKQTITDEKGEFTINGIDENSVLAFSSVNMEFVELRVGGQKEIFAKLKTKTAELDEVQIVAYGQTTKRFQTGNVSTVKAADIEKQPVSNPLLALEGRVPGLFITQTNGVPGGGVTVRIQGQNSIRSGNDPLYVIDGVPYFSQLPSTGIDAILGTSGAMPGVNANGNPLSYINPGDIESISVLKDADATAIYGSRAANGAILITTKKGKAGQMKVDFNYQTGWGKATNQWDMLNTRQYLDMRYEALKNDGIILGNQSPTDARYYDMLVWDTTRYTDWQKTLIGGTARYTNASAGFSGGTSTLQYLVSGNYHKETTVFPGDFSDEKGSIHFNINSTSLNQKLKFQFSGNYMLDNNHLLNTDLTQMAVQMEPNAPALYKTDGNLNWAPNTNGNSTWLNPLAETLRPYKNKTSNLVGNFVASYEIITGLNLKTSLGYTTVHTSDYTAVPLTYYPPEQWASNYRGSQFGTRDLTSWIVEPLLTYTRKIKLGVLDVLAGGTLQKNHTQSGNVGGVGYNSDEVLENLSAATQVFSGNQYIVDYKYNAIFGRINYRWREKYIVNFTGRRDGSSRFGPENQFHNFWGIGGAWILSEEKWIKDKSIISFAKLKGSYGTTGSDQIADYGFMSLYNYWSTPGIPYQGTTGVTMRGLSNPLLAWEETRKLQAGIDLGLVHDKVVISATYNRNRSSNQLLQYALPTVAGYTSFTRNFPALIQNTTWEFSLTSTNIKSKNFSWETQINLSLPKNKLLEFPNIESSSYADGFSGVIVGQPLGVIKAAHSLGANPNTGFYQYADVKGNPVSSPAYPDDF